MSTTSTRRVAVARAPRRIRRALGPVTQLVGGGALVAYDPSPAVTRVIETATGETFDVATPGTCRLGAVGAGRVLMGCPPTDLYAFAFSDPLVLDVGTSAWSKPRPFDDRDRADQPETDDEPVFTLQGIGTRWITGTLSIDYRDYVDHIPDYLPYRPAGPSRRMWPRPDQVIDLDSSSGLRGVCRPIRRPHWGLVRFERPYGLVRPLGRGITMQRCGRARRTLLSACRHNCTAIRLEGGVATWIENNRVFFAPVAHPRRRFSARFSPDLTPVVAIQAHGTAYVLGRLPDGARRLYSVPLPRGFGRR